ncbi:alpha/beta hydrolase family protein [Serratia grimesii]|uniref:alpha/beta hydrolase family protein n=1 Tax=Serratia grimesii TaxID=82995 RepID=UPI00077C588A|nr:dienelactone hydrolase [Serratia grimesii]CAI1092525.1 Predicted dienelactone hydrolase [Serratia grimesii]CAI2515574.1 Predicted dienelactone hydrolase [Serratia grimesii]SUI36180.1 Predicted dienelactone hydrolase [Serratia grimesii]
MKRALLLWLLLCGAASAAPYQVATRDDVFQTGSRALTSRIYYPTTAMDGSHIIGANHVFIGINSQPDAPIASGHFPLIVISHGSGGNNSSQAWLAAALAQQGVIVVAANHPGSTTGDSVPARSAELWLQTKDISALISAITADPHWAQAINRKAIGVIGHSKGGYSAIAVIGGRVRLTDFIRGCQQAPRSPNCQFYTQAKVDLEALSTQQFNADYTDPRIRFAVALDPGMVPYLLPASLRRLSAPLLVIEPQRFEPDSQIPGLGGATLAKDAGQRPIDALRLSKGNHFDFIPLCQPNGRQILAAEEKDAEVLCAFSKAQREWVHQQTVASILTFIRPWLPAHVENR